MLNHARSTGRRIVKHRIAGLAVAATAGFGVAMAPTAVATAAPPPSLTVDSVAHLNTDRSVDVTGTYTCGGGPSSIIRGDSGLYQDDAGVSSPSVTVPGDCDGAAHPYTIHFPPGSYFEFQPGPATFTSVWLFYDANGDPTEAELVNAPITLQN
ncbi:hypothetical protein [Nocardia brasiliensis]|uniref:hypothetical protein n=1 Tax=Nocardia brasiliensis TaxID=37326 RepID=UPI0033FED8F5